MAYCPICGARVTGTGCPTHGQPGAPSAPTTAPAPPPEPLTLQQAAQAKANIQRSRPGGVALPSRIDDLNATQRGQMAHALSLIASVVTLGFGGGVAAFAAYLMLRERPDMGRALAATALNLQIVVTAGVWLAQPLGAFGDAVQWLLVIGGLAAHVIAILKARSGQVWLPDRIPTIVH